jgi:hypothetical protein
MLAASGARGRIREHTESPAEKARGYDPRIVQNNEFVTAQQARKLRERTIRQLIARAIHGQKARAVSPL